MRYLWTTLCAIIAVLLTQRPSIGQELIMNVAPEKITIASNYGGSTVVIFGAVGLKDAASRKFDAVVTVLGPHQNFLVRRKKEVAGIWINGDAKTFTDIPAYVGVFANRPIDKIADENVRQKFKVGLQNLLGTSADPFFANFVAIRAEEEFYSERSDRLTFLTPNVFRAEITFPPNLPTGTYAIDAKVFSAGTFVSQSSAKLELVKVGFEKFVADTAAAHSFLYGLVVLIMALTTGGLASVALRRE